MKRICYYALAAINYKNGNATTCPTQSDYAVKFYNLENDYKQMLPSQIHHPSALNFHHSPMSHQSKNDPIDPLLNQIYHFP